MGYWEATGMGAGEQTYGRGGRGRAGLLESPQCCPDGDVQSPKKLLSPRSRARIAQRDAQKAKGKG